MSLSLIRWDPVRQEGKQTPLRRLGSGNVEDTVTDFSLKASYIATEHFIFSEWSILTSISQGAKKVIFLYIYILRSSCAVGSQILILQGYHVLSILIITEDTQKREDFTERYFDFSNYSLIKVYSKVYTVFYPLIHRPAQCWQDGAEWKGSERLFLAGDSMELMLLKGYQVPL